MKTQNLKPISTFTLALITILGIFAGEAHAGREGGNGGSLHKPQPNPSMSETLLDFYESGGSVAPRYRNWWDCRISGTKVTITSGDHGVSPPPITKDVLWTSLVPDASTILDLLGKARSGEVTGNPRPIGGSYSSCKGFIQDESVSLDQVDQYGWGNRSNEAAILMTFIRENCLQ